MDDAIVESNTIIAPGAVVTKKTIVESGSIYAGTPAKKIKDLDPKLTKGEIERIANSYSMYASWYKKED
jgi:carbonic anhydrase/acetyltransferase-like protein (isoleucine patch superfamily)